MTQTMKLQKDSYTPTSSSSQVTNNDTIISTATNSIATVIIFSDYVVPTKPKNGFVSMDDFLSDLNNDSDFHESLPEGRKWVADSFYKDKKSLAKLRLEKGWSQKQHAEKLNTKQPYIARIENGVEDIQLSTIRKLAIIFNTNILEIVDAIS